MMTRKSQRAKRKSERLRASRDIRPIGNAEDIVSHEIKTVHMKILEDPGDLDCGGSCKVETTIHVPRSDFKLHEKLEPQSAEAGRPPRAILVY